MDNLTHKETVKTITENLRKLQSKEITIAEAQAIKDQIAELAKFIKMKIQFERFIGDPNKVDFYK